MFLSTYEGRLDAKGRVSVPAAYRRALRSGDARGAAISVAIWPTKVMGAACLAVYGLDAMARMMDTFRNAAGPVDDARQAVELTLFSTAKTLRCDSTGRIMLPPGFVEHAGLSEQVICVGAGDHFYLWNPAVYAKVQASAARLVGGARTRMEVAI